MQRQKGGSNATKYMLYTYTGGNGFERTLKSFSPFHVVEVTKYRKTGPALAGLDRFSALNTHKTVYLHACHFVRYIGFAYRPGKSFL